MDIYDYLKMDHKKVAKLFELFETAKTEKNKLEIVAMLNKELTLHAESESATFYKVLESYRKSEDEALHGEEEHQEIKSKLAQIIAMKQANKTLDKHVLELKKLVEHHVSDEEGKIFRAAKKVISEKEANIIKEQMHDLKEKLSYKLEGKEKIPSLKQDEIELS